MASEQTRLAASVVEAVAACVESRYVDATSGARAAESLRRRLNDGGYNSLLYGKELAPRLTADLQEVLPDLHLHVRWSDDAREASTTSN